MIDIDEFFQRNAGFDAHLMDRAVQAANKARSHRGFKVGAAIYALRSNGDTAIFPGFNLMPYENPGPKVCAEQIALGRALDEECLLILAIAVAGVAQPDGVSGLVTETLHPCHGCRTLLSAMPEISPDTRLFLSSLNGPDETSESLRWGELLALHGHREPEGPRWQPEQTVRQQRPPLIGSHDDDLSQIERFLMHGLSARDQ